jgi:hypothetical protein
MYLIMTKEKPTTMIQLKIRELLDVPATKMSYDGESTKTIQDHLKEENKDCAVITADCRFLSLVGEFFTIEDVFIYREDKLIFLSDTTRKQLRTSHNLMKMYEAGSFD